MEKITKKNINLLLPYNFINISFDSFKNLIFIFNDTDF